METCPATEQLGNTIFSCIMPPHNDQKHWMVANVIVSTERDFKAEADRRSRMADQYGYTEPERYNPFYISATRIMIELAGYATLITIGLILTLAVFCPEGLPWK